MFVWCFQRLHEGFIQLLTARTLPMRSSSFGGEWRSDLGSSLIDDTTRDIAHASNNITPQARGDIPNPSQFFPPLNLKQGFSQIFALWESSLFHSGKQTNKRKKITTITISTHVHSCRYGSIQTNRQVADVLHKRSRLIRPKISGTTIFKTIKLLQFRFVRTSYPDFEHF